MISTLSVLDEGLSQNPVSVLKWHHNTFLPNFMSKDRLDLYSHMCLRASADSIEMATPN